MRTRSLVAFTGGLVLFSAILTAPAFAADTFTFGTDLPNYNVGPGQTVDVKLYLVDTRSGGSFLLDSELGLVSAGIAGLQVPTASPGPQPISPARFTQINPDAAFNDPILTPLTSVTATAFSSLAFADVTGTQGALPILVNGTTEKVLLGDLVITAGPTPGDVTTFSLSDYSAGSDTLSFVSEDVLDPQASANFTVTVVAPEPAALSLLTSGVALLIQLRRRPGTHAGE